MELKDLQKHWDAFGETDPLWAIMTWPGKQGGGWHVDEFFETGRTSVASLFADLRALGVEPPTGTALDFGCGVGRVTQALCDHFERCYGVDLAPSMLALARKYNRHGDRCRYVLNQTNDLRFLKGESVDLVFTMIVLQHMQPIYTKNYLKEFLRVVVPGGLVVFQVPAAPAHAWARADVPTGVPPAPRGLAALKARAQQLLRRPNRRADPDFTPVMQMYCIPKDEVIRFVEEQGATVLGVTENKMCGDEFISYQYVLRK